MQAAGDIIHEKSEYLIFTLEGVCSPESLKKQYVFFLLKKKQQTFGTQSKSICPFFAD